MDSKKIGAFIAVNRKKKGLTQEQLGERSILSWDVCW